MYNPLENFGSNQAIGGIPHHTEWDVYAEAFDPMASANHLIIPDTQDAHGGQGFTNFSEAITGGASIPLITYYYDQNYQGIAPMDLQPQLKLPKPWLV